MNSITTILFSTKQLNNKNIIVLFVLSTKFQLIVGCRFDMSYLCMIVM